MSHGNSKENDNDHHLYEINDRERRGLYKYGISGRPLNADGSSPRANEQITLLTEWWDGLDFLPGYYWLEFREESEPKN